MTSHKKFKLTTLTGMVSSAIFGWILSDVAILLMLFLKFSLSGRPQILLPRPAPRLKCFESEGVMKIWFEICSSDSIYEHTFESKQLFEQLINSWKKQPIFQYLNLNWFWISLQRIFLIHDSILTSSKWTLEWPHYPTWRFSYHDWKRSA